MGDWMSWIDGAESDHAVKARNEAFKEVAWLAGGAVTASAFLGALEGYNHAKDPVKGGMPDCGLPGPMGSLDFLVGVGGVVGAILLGDKLGEEGQLFTLGAGLAGLSSVSGHYGRCFGAKMFQPVKAKGHTATGAGVDQMLQEKSTLSPETQRVYDEFMKAA